MQRSLRLVPHIVGIAGLGSPIWFGVMLIVFTLPFCIQLRVESTSLKPWDTHGVSLRYERRFGLNTIALMVALTTA